jgi:hypothetical protein
MKYLPSLLIFALLTACASFTTQSLSPFVGKYEGRWGSQDGAGKLFLDITQLPDKPVDADISFNYNETKIHAKTESVTIMDKQIIILISWDIQSTRGKTKLIGTLENNKISGTLSNSPEENTNDGSWNVTRKNSD